MQNKYHNHNRNDVISLVPEKAKSILDIGCASGTLGYNLKQSRDCVVSGIDNNAIYYKEAKSNLDNFDILDVETDKIDYMYDCIILADVLEHLNNPEELLNKIHMNIKKDGSIVISVPNNRHWTVVDGLLNGDFTYSDTGLLDETHKHLFTRRELQKMLWRAGWKIEEMKAIILPGEKVPEYGNEVHQNRLHIGCNDRAELIEYYTYQYVCRAVRANRRDKKLSVVMPCWNQLEYTQKAINSLKKALIHIDNEIIVIDNGSIDGTKEWCEANGVIVYRNEENLGWIKAVNQGLDKATGDLILLSNNDVIFPEGFADRMIDVLIGVEKAGIVGPLCNNISGYQKIPVGYTNNKDMMGWAWDEQIKRYEQIVETERLIGFCMMITKEFVEDVGGMDERFGLGMCDDDDWCIRSNMKGYKNLIIGGSFVHHAGSITMNTLENPNALLEKNLKLLQEKYGDTSPSWEDKNETK